MRSSPATTPGALQPLLAELLSTEVNWLRFGVPAWRFFLTRGYTRSNVAMMRDTLIVVAWDVSPEAASMGLGLLKSAGIEATALNVAVTTLSGGNGQIAVFEPDAERAQHILQSAGIIGSPPDVRVEVPKDQWAAPRLDNERPAPSPSKMWLLAGGLAVLVGVLVLMLMRCGGGGVHH